MRRLPTIVTLASAAALALAAAGSVAASPTLPYHGVFDGTVEYIGCTTAAPVVEAEGTWSVKLRAGGDAVVAINIFRDGSHHVSFGGVVPQVALVDDEVFAVMFLTGAGDLRISMTGDELSYAFPNGYVLDGMDCENVIYHGTLTH